MNQILRDNPNFKLRPKIRKKVKETNAVEVNDQDYFVYHDNHNFAYGLSSISPIRAFVFLSTTETKKTNLLSFLHTAIS